MDITQFITWFISQIVSMFTWFYNILDSITFAGTSLLKICVTILIITAIIPILLTIGKNSTNLYARSEKYDKLARKKEE